MSRREDPVREFFKGLYHRHGVSHKALDYGSRRTQRKKFDALCSVGDLRGASILDVGCGFGDLYAHLRRRGSRPRYSGMDLVPEMVAAARRLHPRARFFVGDILGRLPARRYDFVVCTGFNCVKTGRNWGALRTALRRMFGLARRGVAFGMVSTKASPKNPRTYYASPEAVLAEAFKLTGRVSLRHDYLPHDFTVYLHKE